MTDCPPVSLNPFLVHPWPVATAISAIMVGLVVFLIWFTLDSRRHRREMAIRLWAVEDPDGYAAVMQRRAETEALVAARMAQSQPWWRRRRG
jgi:hypothetical protein